MPVITTTWPMLSDLSTAGSWTIKRELGKRLGWTVSAIPGSQNWQLRDPSGNSVGQPAPSSKQAAEVGLPDWSEDLVLSLEACASASSLIVGGFAGLLCSSGLYIGRASLGAWSQVRPGVAETLAPREAAVAALELLRQGQPFNSSYLQWRLVSYVNVAAGTPADTALVAKLLTLGATYRVTTATSGTVAGEVLYLDGNPGVPFRGTHFVDVDEDW